MDIVMKEEFYVIGKKVTCPWQELGALMPEAWKTVMERKDEIPNRLSPYILDICLHVIDGEFTQLVGVEVSSLEHIPDGLNGAVIPKQKYIYSKHTDSVMDIAGHFGRMIEWAKENCLTIDPFDFKIQYSPEYNEERGYDLYFKLA
ncbi:GyrI-like domain-containing protein [Peribacillus deserti]|uniref:GyrI-like domain-containing protein n=1 Tax=Peribacillus deserti TaxID=673318 RepID=A0A2N5M5E0_9BACI|nr:GyrI-like domain-containing protein [Peribacillus deserti]PLT29588.1 GyrI-like domain-containing protein [Peribacillus deserti]